MGGFMRFRVLAAAAALLVLGTASVGLAEEDQVGPAPLIPPEAASADTSDPPQTAASASGEKPPPSNNGCVREFGRHFVCSTAAGTWDQCYDERVEMGGEPSAVRCFADGATYEVVVAGGATTVIERQSQESLVDMQTEAATDTSSPIVSPPSSTSPNTTDPLSTVLFLVIAGALVLALVSGIFVADHVWKKYEYRVYLNPINLLNIAAAGLLFGGLVSPMYGNEGLFFLLLALLAWVIVVVWNIRKTNVHMGLIITLVQSVGSLFLLLIWSATRKQQRT